MIKVSDDFALIKAEIKQANQNISDQIKQLKKPYKKEKILPGKVQDKIDSLANRARLYSVSKVLPVKVEDVVINYKLYEAFMTKIKDFNTSILVQPDGVIVQYWKQGSLHQGKGLLKLYDISSYFRGFYHIPNGVLEYDSEA